jgi:hypothetical protein
MTGELTCRIFALSPSVIDPFPFGEIVQRHISLSSPRLLAFPGVMNRLGLWLSQPGLKLLAACLA